MNCPNFSKRIVDEFLGEAHELIDHCEEKLLEIENSDDLDANILNEIFRCAHTLKGSALSSGFNNIGALVHAMENLVSEYRDNNNIQEFAANAEIIDTLLESVDQLRTFVFDIGCNNSTEKDFSNLINKLNYYISSPKKMMTLRDSGLHLFAEDVPKQKSTLKGKVFICDDDKLIVEIMTSQIEKLGYSVISFNCPLIAVQEIKKGIQFDILISDLNMPGINGIEFVTEVMKIHQDVPVIFCSSFAQKSDVAKFLEMGAFAFIEKSWKISHLEVLLNNAMIVKHTGNKMVELLGLARKVFSHSNGVIFAEENEDIQVSKKNQDRLRKDFDQFCYIVGEIIRYNINFKAG